MTKHRRPKNQKHKASADQKKPDANGEAIVDHTSKSEDKKGTTLHGSDAPDQQRPPSPSKFFIAVYHWLLHWWDAPREKSKAADWAVAVLTVAIAIAAIWSACIFQGQLEEARRLTIISERPWLDINVEPSSDLTFNNEGVNVTVTFLVKNFGKSIAQRTQINAKVSPVAPSLPVAPQAGDVQEELCRSPGLQRIGTFDVLPDNKPIEPAPEQGVGVPMAEMNSLAVKSRDDSSRRFIGLYLVGCITYFSSFEPNPHQTRFAYHLGGPLLWQPDGKLLFLANGIFHTGDFEIGITIPKGRITMTKELFGSNGHY